MFEQLISLGWKPFFQDQLDLNSPARVGRIVEEQRNIFHVATEKGEVWSHVAGRLRHELAAPGDEPAVGDWVELRFEPGDDRAAIVRVLKRLSKFSRAAPQTGAEQVVAANVDVALVVVAIGGDFNLRRVERYVTAVYECGAQPVVVLTKADLLDEDAVADHVEQVESVAPGVRAIATSAHASIGLNALRSAVPSGDTAVLVGSSGTGKSSLVNALCGGDVQHVSQVSAHQDKGRHTTTSRKLIVLPHGGLLVDTPGMRELQLYNVSEEGLGQTFADVEQLVARCRFTDCEHRTGPGCAVRQSLEDGTLDEERWRSFLKLQREAMHQQRELDANLARLERERWKKIAMHNRRNPKLRF